MRQGRWEQKRQLRSDGLHAWALSDRDLCFEVISGFIDRLSSGRDVGLCPKKARDEYRKLGSLWALRITVPFAQVLRSLAASAPLSTLLFVRHLRLSGNPVVIRLSAPWWGYLYLGCKARQQVWDRYARLGPLEPPKGGFCV